MKQKEFKQGFIITYFNSDEGSEKILENLVDVMSKENYYLVISSHSSIPQSIQEKCDYFIYEKLNAVDDKQYSHGIAESTLIHKALLHLRECDIHWTYKICYDVDIKKPGEFKEWVHDHEFSLVTSLWGNGGLSSHSFYASVDFMLDEMPFYDTFEEMLASSNVLEIAWMNHCRENNLLLDVYLYSSANEMYKENKFNLVYYDYKSLDFTFDKNESKFYITNRLQKDLDGQLCIYDYYTDLVVAYYKNFPVGNGGQFWIIPPSAQYLPESKNGFYLVYKTENFTYRRNIGIHDFTFKHPFSKRWASLIPRFHYFSSYCDFKEYVEYKNIGLNPDNIKSCLDIGANYGFFSAPLMQRGAKVWLVEGDQANAADLQKMYSGLDNVTIIPKAVYNIDGEIDFYQDDVSVVSGVKEDYSQSRQDRKKTRVPSVTPDTLVSPLEEIDLMKIDIEGAEYVFFEKISIENLRKFKNILIEWHDNNDNEVSVILKKLAKSNFSYSFYYWGGYRNPNFTKNQMGIIYATRLD